MTTPLVLLESDPANGLPPHPALAARDDRVIILEGERIIYNLEAEGLRELLNVLKEGEAERCKQKSAHLAPHLVADQCKTVIQEVFKREDVLKYLESPAVPTTELLHKVEAVTDEQAKRIIVNWAGLECRNAQVTEYSDVLSSVLGCNNNVSLLGGAAAAKAAMYYMIKYVTKPTTERNLAVSVFYEAAKAAEKYPSKAADSKTNPHRPALLIAQKSAHRLDAEYHDTWSANGVLHKSPHEFSHKLESYQGHDFCQLASILSTGAQCGHRSAKDALDAHAEGALSFANDGGSSDAGSASDGSSAADEMDRHQSESDDAESLPESLFDDGLGAATKHGGAAAGGGARCSPDCSQADEPLPRSSHVDEPLPGSGEPVVAGCADAGNGSTGDELNGGDSALRDDELDAPRRAAAARAKHEPFAKPRVGSDGKKVFVPLSFDYLYRGPLLSRFSALEYIGAVYSKRKTEAQMAAYVKRHGFEPFPRARLTSARRNGGSPLGANGRDRPPAAATSAPRGGGKPAAEEEGDGSDGADDADEGEASGIEEDLSSGEEEAGSDGGGNKAGRKSSRYFDYHRHHPLAGLYHQVLHSKILVPQHCGPRVPKAPKPYIRKGSKIRRTEQKWAAFHIALHVPWPTGGKEDPDAASDDESMQHLDECEDALEGMDGPCPPMLHADVLHNWVEHLQSIQLGGLPAGSSLSDAMLLQLVQYVLPDGANEAVAHAVPIPGAPAVLPTATTSVDADHGAKHTWPDNTDAKNRKEHSIAVNRLRRLDTFSNALVLPQHAKRLSTMFGARMSDILPDKLQGDGTGGGGGGNGSAEGAEARLKAQQIEDARNPSKRAAAATKKKNQAVKIAALLHACSQMARGMPKLPTATPAEAAAYPNGGDCPWVNDPAGGSTGAVRQAAVASVQALMEKDPFQPAQLPGVPPPHIVELLNRQNLAVAKNRTAAEQGLPLEDVPEEALPIEFEEVPGADDAAKEALLEVWVQKWKVDERQAKERGDEPPLPPLNREQRAVCRALLPVLRTQRRLRHLRDGKRNLYAKELHRLHQTTYFLLGPAGAGKTKMLQVLEAVMLRDCLGTIIFCAWTGVAAILLPHGLTICKLTGIDSRRFVFNGDPAVPVEHNFTAFRNAVGDPRDIGLLVIDECSQNGAVCLHHISSRVGDLLGAPAGLDFGGLPTLNCGDFMQLPPVGQTDLPTSMLQMYLANVPGKKKKHVKRGSGEEKGCKIAKGMKRLQFQKQMRGRLDPAHYANVEEMRRLDKKMPVTMRYLRSVKRYSVKDALDPKRAFAPKLVLSRSEVAFWNHDYVFRLAKHLQRPVYRWYHPLPKTCLLDNVQLDGLRKVELDLCFEYTAGCRGIFFSNVENSLARELVNGMTCTIIGHSGRDAHRVKTTVEDGVTVHTSDCQPTHLYVEPHVSHKCKEGMLLRGESCATASDRLILPIACTGKTQPRDTRLHSSYAAGLYGKGVLPGTTIETASLPIDAFGANTDQKFQGQSHEYINWAMQHRSFIPHPSVRSLNVAASRTYLGDGQRRLDRDSDAYLHALEQSPTLRIFLESFNDDGFFDAAVAAKRAEAMLQEDAAQADECARRKHFRDLAKKRGAPRPAAHHVATAAAAPHTTGSAASASSARPSSSSVAATAPQKQPSAPAPRTPAPRTPATKTPAPGTPHPRVGTSRTPAAMPPKRASPPLSSSSKRQKLVPGSCGYTPVRSIDVFQGPRNANMSCYCDATFSGCILSVALHQRRLGVAAAPLTFPTSPTDALRDDVALCMNVLLAAQLAIIDQDATAAPHSSAALLRGLHLARNDLRRSHAASRHRDDPQEQRAQLGRVGSVSNVLHHLLDGKELDSPCDIFLSAFAKSCGCKQCVWMSQYSGCTHVAWSEVVDLPGRDPFDVLRRKVRGSGACCSDIKPNGCAWHGNGKLVAFSARFGAAQRDAWQAGGANGAPSGLMIVIDSGEGDAGDIRLNASAHHHLTLEGSVVVTYRLIGVVYHMPGHFIADVDVSPQGSDRQQWVRYDGLANEGRAEPVPPPHGCTTYGNPTTRCAPHVAVYGRTNVLPSNTVHAGSFLYADPTSVEGPLRRIAAIEASADAPLLPGCTIDTFQYIRQQGACRGTAGGTSTSTSICITKADASTVVCSLDGGTSKVGVLCEAGSSMEENLTYHMPHLCAQLALLEDRREGELQVACINTPLHNGPDAPLATVLRADMPRLQGSSHTAGDASWWQSMLVHIEVVLQAAVAARVQVLVLTASGCQYHHPERCAVCFCTLLCTPRYANAFHKVVFAIPNDGVRGSFSNTARDLLFASSPSALRALQEETRVRLVHCMQQQGEAATLGGVYMTTKRLLQSLEDIHPADLAAAGSSLATAAEPSERLTVRTLNTQGAFLPLERRMYECFALKVFAYGVDPSYATAVLPPADPGWMSIAP